MYQQFLTCIDPNRGRVGFEGQKDYLGLQSSYAIQPPYESSGWNTNNDPYAPKPAYNSQFVPNNMRQDLNYYGSAPTETFPQYGNTGFNNARRPGKYDEMGTVPMPSHDSMNPYYHTSTPYQDPMAMQQMKYSNQRPAVAPNTNSYHSQQMHGMPGQYNRGGPPARGMMPSHQNMGGNPNMNPYMRSMGGAGAQYSGPAGTGGSNAQGRAINKMLLEIVRERVIDPQRLDMAIETYTERMDCVNLATLLFHTGKKRLLLVPAYIKRIACRFVTLKEELRAREASNALYGLKCMSSELPEVRELVYALAGKVATSPSDFVAQAVGNALYGLQMMSSDHEEVRYMLSVLATKVARCTELLEAQNVGNALYGLRNMSSDHREVRAVIAALTPKIATAREDLNGQALGNSLYGLQSMSSKEPEVRFLLAVLATKVTRTWEELKAQEVGNALYGLKRMSTDVPEVRILISALVPKVAASPEILDAQAIGNSFYGLQNMKSDNAEVLSLLAVMAEKVAMSCPELDGQAMGNSLYGLQGMNSDYPEVRAVVAALTAKMQASCLDMNAQEMGNALFGLQNMTSEHADIRRLMNALTHKVNASKHDLTSQEIGNAMFGLQGMSSSVFETRMLVRQIALKIQQSHSVIDPLGVSNSLFGLQRMSSESEDVRLLVQALSIKIEHTWKLLSAQHISNALYGLQGLSSAENEVRYLIKALVPKVLSCRDEMNAKQLSNAMFGLRNLSSDHGEVLALMQALAEKVANSSEQWQLSQLAMVLYGMQGMSSSREEVGSMLSAVALKAIDLVQEKNVDVTALANAFFGLQRMTTNNPDVHRIVGVLLNKLASVPSNVVVNARACANMIYGLHGSSCAHEVVKKLMYRIADHIQKVSDTFMGSPRQNNVVDAYGETVAPHERLEDILVLYQATALSLFALRDLDNDADLQARMYAELSSLRSIVDSHKSELPAPSATSAEKRLHKELSDVLSREPFTVSTGVLVHGFEMNTLVQLAPSIQLKTSTGSNWSPVLNLEVRGSSFASPAKELFFRLRKHYLEQEKGILVDYVPADSFRIDGQQGLKIHSAVLTPLYPPTLEDANNFSAKLSAMGLSQQKGLLGLSAENFFTFNGSQSLDHHADHNVGLSQQEYHDDDFKRSVVSSFNDSKKYKFNLTSRAQKCPLSLPLTWLGDWPLVSHPLAGFGGSNHNSPHVSPKNQQEQLKRGQAQSNVLTHSMAPQHDHNLLLSHNNNTYGAGASYFNDLSGHNGSANKNLLSNASFLNAPQPPQHHQQQQQPQPTAQFRHSDDESSTSTTSGDRRQRPSPHNHSFGPTDTVPALNLNLGSSLNIPQLSIATNSRLFNTSSLSTDLSSPATAVHSAYGMNGYPSSSGEQLTPTASFAAQVHSSSLQSMPTAREGEPPNRTVRSSSIGNSEVDDEIAALEAQLEVARLEARIKELKTKKAVAPNPRSRAVSNEIETN